MCLRYPQLDSILRDSSDKNKFLIRYLFITSLASLALVTECSEPAASRSHRVRPGRRFRLTVACHETFFLIDTTFPKSYLVASSAW